ncbi:restriction endonuclease [Vibrio diabolicus]|uniref:restriction endonuclease n=1 Tax=Vibrio diabolicus TaxID=50719 RepID=UPI003D7EC935
MWIFDGVIEASCDECGSVYKVPVKDFEVDCYDSSYSENGMGQQNDYQLLYQFDCTRCGNDISLDFDVTEYPVDFLSYVINNSSGADCNGEPYFTYLDESPIYILPEPKIWLPGDDRIITDINLIRSNIPDLVRFLRDNPQHLHQIEPREFEQVIAEIFKHSGFEVTLTKSTRDGGKDIIAVQRHALGIDTKYFIEYKRYAPDNKVGVEVVRALHGVKNTIGGPNKVILVTTSAFTQGAIDFAQSQASSCWDISLKDYQDILSWLSAYQ